MAGKRGRSGRRRAPGRLYRLSLRYRPGVDPAELGELLEAIASARGRKREDILRQALIGGTQAGRQAAAHQEDSETKQLIDDLLGEF
jgi:hypothetical protein